MGGLQAGEQVDPGDREQQGEKPENRPCRLDGERAKEDYSADTVPKGRGFRTGRGGGGDSRTTVGRKKGQKGAGWRQGA